MTAGEIDYVRKCIQSNDLHRFYTWARWLHIRSEVLDKDKHECQGHKGRGQYARATLVHHVKHVKQYPEFALEPYYVDGLGEKQRQLVSLCDACHDKEHPGRIRWRGCKKPLTPERW